jgi:hypothetical protein
MGDALDDLACPSSRALCELVKIGIPGSIGWFEGFPESKLNINLVEEDAMSEMAKEAAGEKKIALIVSRYEFRDPMPGLYRKLGRVHMYIRVRRSLLQRVKVSG